MVKRKYLQPLPVRNKGFSNSPINLQAQQQDTGNKSITR
ncbi:hypothetical protein AOR13_1465 [Alteromonas stellipolaris LMG 21856]|nr:hypothetical protein AOR13_1465 [Alteromonas stellipolaris LMG 21856]